MLDTFKARLKVKFPGVNLSQKRIDAIADRLHKIFPDLAEEADHDKELDRYNEYQPFEETARQDDRLRTLENKPQPPAPANPPEAAPPAPLPQDDMPAWFKSYKEENDAKLNGLLKEKHEVGIRQKLKESLKDVPEAFYDEWQLPTKDEDIEAFRTKVKEKYQTVTQALPPPIVGLRPATNVKVETGKTKQATDAELKEIFGDK